MSSPFTNIRVFYFLLRVFVNPTWNNRNKSLRRRKNLGREQLRLCYMNGRSARSRWKFSRCLDVFRADAILGISNALAYPEPAAPLRALRCGTPQTIKISNLIAASAVHHYCPRHHCFAPLVLLYLYDFFDHFLSRIVAFAFVFNLCSLIPSSVDRWKEWEAGGCELF